MTTLYPPRKAVKTVSVAAVRWSIAVVFIICMGTSFVVAVQGVNRDDDLRRVVAVQNAVVAQAHTDNRNLCLASNTAATSSNTILATLTQLVSHTGTLPRADQQARLRIIAGMHKVPVIVCKP